MNSTPSSDIRAMRATASALDAQRDKLPVLGDPHRSPDVAGVARQISALGELITDLGNEVHFSTSREPEAHTARVITAFAATVRPTGQAASALGEVARQLSFLDRTEHLRDEPDADDAREAAVQLIDDSLNTADTALREAADSLRAASATVSPPSVRLRAALSRSAAAASVPAPPPAAQTAAVPAGVVRRSR
ncbi:hypothetical protein [Streptomyces sp. NPDC019224]|uniref:hypothetical protein n=1 Tax=Streptomyces sp. NPDC019224 TaxID=3154484 RepID=UPI0033FF3421